MKKLLILIPVAAILASCKSTTVVEAPKTPPPEVHHTNTVVPVPVPTSPAMSTTVRRTSTTVYP